MLKVAFAIESSDGTIKLVSKDDVDPREHDPQHVLDNSEEILSYLKQFMKPKFTTKLKGRTKLKRYIEKHSIDFTYLYVYDEWLISDGNGFFGLQQYIQNKGNV